MDSHVRKWVAASLLHGHAAEQLGPALEKAGFSREEIEQELTETAPYIAVISKLQKKSGQREALLKTLDALLRRQTHYLTLEKVALPPFEQFLEDYYYPNRCGLFSSVLDNCAAKQWTPRSLIEKVGATTLIEIQDKRLSHNIYEHNSNACATRIPFSSFIDRMEETGSSNDFYMAGNNYAFNRTPFEPLRKELQDIGNGYLVPEDERINKMHFMFGPQGAVTAVHYDNVNVLLIQAYGRKYVRLIPAMQVPYLYNNNREYTADFDLLNPNPVLYPDFKEATIIETEIGPGDCLFIPIGWWHHVTCLSPTISVTCCNIKSNSEFKIYL